MKVISLLLLFVTLLSFTHSRLGSLDSLKDELKKHDKEIQERLDQAKDKIDHDEALKEELKRANIEIKDKPQGDQESRNVQSFLNEQTEHSVKDAAEKIQDQYDFSEDDLPPKSEIKVFVQNGTLQIEENDFVNAPTNMQEVLHQLATGARAQDVMTEEEFAEFLHTYGAVIEKEFGQTPKELEELQNLLDYDLKFKKALKKIDNEQRRVNQAISEAEKAYNKLQALPEEVRSELNLNTDSQIEKFMNEVDLSKFNYSFDMLKTMPRDLKSKFHERSQIEIPSGFGR